MVVLIDYRKVTELKDIQTATKEDINKVSYEVEHFKSNFKRVEDKIDRIYDPEDGLYLRVTQVENNNENTQKSIEQLDEKIHDINKAHSNTKQEMYLLKKTTEDISSKMILLNNVAGENFEELHSTIKVKKNLSKMIWLFITGFFGTLAKILWDILSN